MDLLKCYHSPPLLPRLFSLITTSFRNCENSLFIYVNINRSTHTKMQFSILFICALAWSCLFTLHVHYLKSKSWRSFTLYLPFLKFYQITARQLTINLYFGHCCATEDPYDTYHLPIRKAFTNTVCFRFRNSAVYIVVLTNIALERFLNVWLFHMYSNNFKKLFYNCALL